jgi:hypothetical protein
VSQQEVMHGLVPLSGEFIPGRRIPLWEAHISIWQNTLKRLVTQSS